MSSFRRVQALLQSVDEMAKLIADLHDLRMRVQRAEATALARRHRRKKVGRRRCRFDPADGCGEVQPNGWRETKSDRSMVLPKADVGSAGGHVGFWPQADLTLKHRPRERPFHQTVAGRIEWPQRNATTSSARPETEDDADRNGTTRDQPIRRRYRSRIALRCIRATRRHQSMVRPAFWISGTQRLISDWT